MSESESVLSCYLFAMKTFNSSFAEIDDMDLGLFLDLLNVYDKVNDAEKEKNDNKIRYKVLDN